MLRCGAVLCCVASLGACTSLRVIGGRDAGERQYPYVVRLETKSLVRKNNNNFTKYSHTCTCSALTAAWTVSARHCVDKPYRALSSTSLAAEVLSRHMIVRYGPLPQLGEPRHARTRDVITVVTLAGTRMPVVSADDIALLKTQPIHLPQYGHISALHYDSLRFQEVTVAGYGLTNYTSSHGQVLASTLDLSKPLQLVKGMLHQCEDGDGFPLWCVSQACGRPTAICPGDSGGPVMHRSGIVALNSKGPSMNNCQMKSDVYRIPMFAVVLPLSPYMDWISNVVNDKNYMT